MKFINNKFTAEYPLYGATFVQSDLKEAIFLVTGGGGEGKNGIPNMITSYKYDTQSGQLEKLYDYELPEDDDSPTAIDSSLTNRIVLIGCNENSEKIKSGKGNNHLRKFQLDSKFQLKPIKSIDLFQSCNPDEYTKFIQFSLDGQLAAVVPCMDSRVLIKIINAVTLEEKFEINDTGKEVKDIGFAPNGKYIAYITSDSLEIISTVTGKSITRLNQDFISNGWNLSKMKFINDDSLLIVATQIYKNGDKRKSGTVLIKVSLKNGDATIIQSKLLTNKFKGITSMDLNESNDLLTLATNENSVLIIQLSNFKIKETFNQIHSFAVTKITISADGKYVVSVSAANTIHIIEIPDSFKDLSSNSFESLQLWFSVILLLSVIVFYNLPVENRQYIKSHIEDYLLQFCDLIKDTIKNYGSAVKIENSNHQNEEIRVQDLFNHTTLIGNFSNRRI